MQVSRVLAQSGRTVAQEVIRLALASHETDTTLALECTLPLVVAGAFLGTRLYTIFIKYSII